MYRNKYRRSKGHSIAELGPALFMVLLIMVLPMATLASLGIRYAIMFYAVRQAAREAAKSSQFLADETAYKRSARNRANDVIALFSNTSGANGLKLIATNTYCDVMNIGSGATARYGPAAAIPAAVVIDPTSNVYNITVQVDAEVRPLFEGGTGWFKAGVGIPGLTKSFPVRMVSAAMCENPAGMHN